VLGVVLGFVAILVIAGAMSRKKQHEEKA